ncbi:MAG TPA: hypothetical protein PKD16_09655 [Saprospiraceae bacterium]|jgi:hypothetical protein|nr:hypothetical protein [Saprospiraceae bacterium]HMT70414.1 hypothetical protein [Saprospiraceae bacterium]
MAKVKVTKESPTGRNEKFEISRADFVKQIENGGHPGYHIRIIKGVKTPCANPNKSDDDNLG